MGRYDEALLHTREALRINPEQHRAHIALGLIMKHRGEPEQAIEHFSQALRLHPGDEVASENLRQLQAEPDPTDFVADLAGQRGGMVSQEN